MRRQHLENRLQIAKDQQDKKVARNILQILHQEADEKRWRRVNRSVGKPRCRQVLLVKVPGEDGGTEDFATKSGVYTVVKQNLSGRVCLASTTPSCSEYLFDDIGFWDNTESVQQILEGTYIFPEGTDPATHLLLEDAAATYANLSNEEVVTYVMSEDFQYY